LRQFIEFVLPEKPAGARNRRDISGRDGAALAVTWEHRLDFADMDDAAIAPDAFLYEKPIATRLERRDSPTQQDDWSEQHQSGKGRGDVKCSFQ
jgi:hypothetical protein